MTEFGTLVLAIAIVCTFAFVASASSVDHHDGPIPVRLVQTDGGWILERGGEPYHIRGVGGTTRLELFASLGGNSIRTWGAQELEPRDWPDGTHRSLLDVAHELGLTVCAGFWVGHPRHGFDYSDEQAVEAQLDRAREFVEKWKDHPAILLWGVGNEVKLTIEGDDRIPLLHEIDRVAKVFKDADPNHPTMHVFAGVWPDLGAMMAAHTEHIDILGTNAYGGLPAVGRSLRDQGYDGPFIPGEYGTLGHWEVPKTDWGAEIEQSSADKAAHYARTHTEGILNESEQALGGYVFLWGQKQERTDTWYGMFLESGEKTQAVDEMAKQWSGSYPSNRAPIVQGIRSDLAMQRVAAGAMFDASVEASDLEGDPLEFEWVVRREQQEKGLGGDTEPKLGPVPEAIASSDGSFAKILVPEEPGPYRLQVYVRDGQGGAGYANIPFYVKSE